MMMKVIIDCLSVNCEIWMSQEEQKMSSDADEEDSENDRMWDHKEMKE